MGGVAMGGVALGNCDTKFKRGFLGPNKSENINYK